VATVRPWAKAATCPPDILDLTPPLGNQVAVPLLSSYAASKHAVACFAACLRMELSALWEIDVCTVFPSFHQTPLLETGAGTIDRTWSAAPAEARRDYGEGFGDAAKVGRRYTPEDQNMARPIWNITRH